MKKITKYLIALTVIVNLLAMIYHMDKKFDSGIILMFVMTMAPYYFLYRFNQQPAKFPKYDLVIFIGVLIASVIWIYLYVESFVINPGKFSGVGFFAAAYYQWGICIALKVITSLLKKKNSAINPPTSP